MPASESFDKLMKESRDELMNLRMQLQSLMVKFGLRALKTYQAARTEALRPIEVASLVKYELDNVITDPIVKGFFDDSRVVYFFEAFIDGSGWGIRSSLR